MKNYLMMAALVAMLPFSSPVLGQEAAGAAPSKVALVKEQPKKAHRTLAEEKAILRKRLDRLDKMTEEQWQARQKARAERRAKWKQLSPEQQAAMKEGWQARRAVRQKGDEPPAAAPAR